MDRKRVTEIAKKSAAMGQMLGDKEPDLVAAIEDGILQALREAMGEATQEMSDVGWKTYCSFDSSNPYDCLVAAYNAMAAVRLRGMTGGVMSPADIETIEDAAATLDGIALETRHCHTLGPDHNDWTGEPEAEAEYARLKALVANLYDMTTRPPSGPQE